MGTHSALGVQLPDGSITGCYVHYDGATLAERLDKFLTEKTTTDLTILITQAQASGGMRGFHYSIDNGPVVTDFLDDDVAYVIDETNWHMDHMGTYAWYLVNYENGTFESKEKYG
jgi:hypothetical protein